MLRHLVAFKLRKGVYELEAMPVDELLHWVAFFNIREDL